MITSQQMADGLVQLFPAATPILDYQVIMLPGGSGEIINWNLSAAIPTEDQLIAAAALYQPTKALIACQEARAQRYEAEASVYDLADAETKLASSDASVQAVGAVQKAAVLTARLAIKAALPKPQ